MKIVILDECPLNSGDISWHQFSDFGEVEVYSSTSENQVIQRIRDADIVITNKVPLRKEQLSEAAKLKYISLLATGYDCIDLEAARTLGIVVSNVPGYGSHSVSQFVFSLLLDICNGVAYHNDSVHAGLWEKRAIWSYWETPQIELCGKTMGIIGYGKIGKKTAAIAAAFGMKCIINSTNASSSEGIKAVGFEELCRSSDVIALHCPLTSKTREIINRESLAMMKPTTILINNSRGGLINDIDLARALNEGIIYAAGLDVVSKEPIQSDNPLYHAKNCLITPHMSWASTESRNRIVRETYLNIKGYVSNNPRNRVT